MVVSDKKVVISIRVPKSVDSFFEMVSTKTIETMGKRVVVTVPKSDKYLEAIIYAMEHSDDWLRKGRVD